MTRSSTGLTSRVEAAHWHDERTADCHEPDCRSLNIEPDVCEGTVVMKNTFLHWEREIPGRPRELAATVLQSRAGGGLFCKTELSIIFKTVLLETSMRRQGQNRRWKQKPLP